MHAFTSAAATQVLPAASAGGALALARSMWAREGPRVFLKGATARLLTLAPGTALSWMVYEPLKRMLSE